MKLIKIFAEKNKQGQFRNEIEYVKNLEKHMQLTPQVVKQLCKDNGTSNKQLNLEYFFYTNTLEKAAQLATELKKLHYSVEYGSSIEYNKSFMVNGWSTKMTISKEVVTQWTIQMCKIGYEFDCEFDGWGASPAAD